MLDKFLNMLQNINTIKEHFAMWTDKTTTISHVCVCVCVCVWWLVGFMRFRDMYKVFYCA